MYVKKAETARKRKLNWEWASKFTAAFQITQISNVRHTWNSRWRDRGTSVCYWLEDLESSNTHDTLHWTSNTKLIFFLNSWKFHNWLMRTGWDKLTQYSGWSLFSSSPFYFKNNPQWLKDFLNFILFLSIKRNLFIHPHFSCYAIFSFGINQVQDQSMIWSFGEDALGLHSPFLTVTL